MRTTSPGAAAWRRNARPVRKEVGTNMRSMKTIRGWVMTVVTGAVLASGTAFGADATGLAGPSHGGRGDYRDRDGDRDGWRRDDDRGHDRDRGRDRGRDRRHREVVVHYTLHGTHRHRAYSR